jgi:hypothetical protein
MANEIVKKDKLFGEVSKKTGYHELKIAEL